VHICCATISYRALLLPKLKITWLEENLQLGARETALPYGNVVSRAVACMQQLVACMHECLEVDGTFLARADASVLLGSRSHDAREQLVRSIFKADVRTAFSSQCLHCAHPALVRLWKDRVLHGQSSSWRRRCRRADGVLLRHKLISALQMPRGNVILGMKHEKQYRCGGNTVGEGRMRIAVGRHRLCQRCCLSLLGDSDSARSSEARCLVLSSLREQIVGVVHVRLAAA